jgi:hypothetical protein
MMNLKKLRKRLRKLLTLQRASQKKVLKNRHLKRMWRRTQTRTK